MSNTCVHNRFNGVLQDGNVPFFNKIKVHITKGDDFYFFFGGVVGKGVKFTLVGGARFYKDWTEIGAVFDVDNYSGTIPEALDVRDIDSENGNDMWIENYYYLTYFLSDGYSRNARTCVDIDDLKYNKDLVKIKVRTYQDNCDIGFLKQNPNLTDMYTGGWIKFDVNEFVNTFIEGGRSSGTLNFGCEATSEVTFNNKSINVNSWGSAPITWESASKVSVGPSAYGLGTNSIYCLGYTDEEIAQKWPGKSVTKVD